MNTDKPNRDPEGLLLIRVSVFICVHLWLFVFFVVQEKKAGVVVPMPTLLFVQTGFVPFHWPHRGRGAAAIQTAAKPTIHAPAWPASHEHARTITQCARFIPFLLL